MAVTGYVSHDSPPWFGSVTVVGLLLCATACLVVTSASRAPEALPADELAPAAS
ncbi:hypothetical protein SAMN06266982_10296 [Propioniciclava tarda]|nr:hypothetical protein SAMN06266982_10296 [Propioniciclava tarda]